MKMGTPEHYDMPLTGLLQSVLTDGSVLSDARANDLVLRTVVPGGRLLFANGSNVLSTAWLSSNELRANVTVSGACVQAQELHAGVVALSNATCASLTATDLTSTRASTSNMECSNALLGVASVPSLYAANVQASNLQTTGLQAATVRVTGAIVGEPSVRLGGASFPLTVRDGPNGPVLSGCTVDGMLELSSGLRVLSGTSTFADVAAASLAASNASCDNLSLRVLRGPDGQDRLRLDAAGTIVTNSELRASNVSLCNLRAVSIGLGGDSNTLVRSAIGLVTRAPSVSVLPANGNAGDDSLLLLTSSSNNTAWVTTNSATCSLSLGVGQAPSLQVGSNGWLAARKQVVLDRGVPLGWGADGDCGVVSRAASVVTVIGSNAAELVRFQANASGRGGCAAFSNQDAGARFVLWQDPSDINAFGGLGKESGVLVVRTPPSQGISFVGGNGALGTEYARFGVSGQLAVNASPGSARVHARATTDERVLVVENTVGASTLSLVQCLRSTNATSNVPASLEFRVNGTLAGSVTHPTPSSTLYGTASDRRLKDVLGDLGADRACETVLALRPVRFRFLADGQDGPEQVGFLADEVQRVAPQCVTTVTTDGGPDNVMVLDAARLVPYLVSAVQHLLTSRA